jgi:predicted dehydrogenase
MTPHIAVAGAGKWGMNHVRNLHQLGLLAAVADPSASVREALNRDFPGVSVVASVAELTALDEVRGVVLATPAHLHADDALPVIHSGRHVLVEKPMAMTSIDARKIVEAAAAADVACMVGHLLLFNPAYQALRTAVQGGLIGELRFVSIDRLNFGTVRPVEDALWSLGVHDVAVAVDLVGCETAEVQAHHGYPLGRTVADDVTLAIRFSSGPEARIRSSWLSPTKLRQLVAIGTTGMLELDETSMTVTLHRKKVAADLALHDEGSEVLCEFPGSNMVAAELTEFARRIASGDRRGAADGWNGVAVIELMERASKGAAHG